jgi:hypothetical protein
MRNYFSILFRVVLFGWSTAKKSTADNFEKERGFISFDDPRIQYEGRFGKKSGEAAELY